MRILLTVHCFYPKHIFGTETYTLEIARTLQALGHNVCVLTTNSHTEPADGRDYIRYEFDSVPVISLDTSNFPNTSFKDTYVKDGINNVIKQIVAEFQPDIVHSLHVINLTVTFLKDIQDMGIPAMATLTDFFGVCLNCKLQTFNGKFCTGPDWLASNCLECYFAETRKSDTIKNKSVFLRKLCSPVPLAFVAKILKSGQIPLIQEVNYITERKATIQRHYEVFQRLIAPTSFLRTAYVNNGYPGDKVQKITFGLNRQPLEGYTHPRNSFKKKLTFGYIGQLYWHKGVDLLMEAFNKLNDPELKLMIYGDKNQDINYTEKLNLLKGDNPNIQLLGTFPRERLGEFLHNIDVLVIPSLWYENAPLVLLNALATRTPVIASDVDGMNEFIKHDFNGMLFDPGDMQDLYRKLKECIDYPEDLIRISHNANYEKSIKDNVEELLQIYKECISERHRVSKRT